MKTIAYIAYFDDTEIIVIGTEVYGGPRTAGSLQIAFDARNVTHVNVTGQDGFHGDNPGGEQTVQEFLEWALECE